MMRDSPFNLYDRINIMITIARVFGRVMIAISIVMMLLLAIPVTFEALMRSFGSPTIWVFETTLYAFIFLVFIGNALAVQSGSHFRVTLLAELFPQFRKQFDLVSHLSVLMFSILIITSGSYFVWYSWSNSIVSATLLEIPMWIPQFAIPLGGLGLFMQTLVVMSDGDDESAQHSKLAGE
jgi:TRAP-type C4-dicarboxylate transport system permease small subunit